MKRYLFPFVALCFLAIPVTAQDDAGDSGDKPIQYKVWEAALPGGVYTVRLGSISTVSISEYISNSTTRVYEVNVVASGSSLARFYYLEPVTDKSPLNVGQVVIDRVQQVAEEAGSRTGLSDVYKKVVKDYPNTTHEHTIEFRLASLEELQSLHNSARKAFLTGRGARFTITSGED